MVALSRRAVGAEHVPEKGILIDLIRLRLDVEDRFPDRISTLHSCGLPTCKE